MKIVLDLAKIEPGHFVSISIPLGDAKFVTKEGSRSSSRTSSNINKDMYIYYPQMCLPPGLGYLASLYSAGAGEVQHTTLA